MENKLFDDKLSGAKFSNDRRFRYILWRVWDELLPKVMFIGLNPSKANEGADDNTITKVCKIAKHNGFGGVYMMNCFPFVSTNPDDMVLCEPESFEWKVNNDWLEFASKECAEIVFAWGNFKVVSKMKRDEYLKKLFPNARALHINNNGSPKHPLYCKDESKFIPYIQSKQQ